MEEMEHFWMYIFIGLIRSLDVAFIRLIEQLAVLQISLIPNLSCITEK